MQNDKPDSFKKILSHIDAEKQSKDENVDRDGKGKNKDIYDDEDTSSEDDWDESAFIQLCHNYLPKKKRGRFAVNISQIETVLRSEKRDVSPSAFKEACTRLFFAEQNATKQRRDKMVNQKATIDFLQKASPSIPINVESFLSKVITTFVAENKLDTNGIKKRTAFIHDLEARLQRRYRDFSIHIECFGGFGYGCSSKDGDLDLVLQADKKYGISKLFHGFIKTSYCGSCFIPARVPIISYVSDDISFDLSVHRKDGVYKTNLLSEYFKAFPRLRDVFLFLKIRMKQSHALDPKNGGMTVHSLSIILISFGITKKYLPCLVNSDPSTEKVLGGKLLEYPFTNNEFRSITPEMLKSLEPFPSVGRFFFEFCWFMKRIPGFNAFFTVNSEGLPFALTTKTIWVEEMFAFHDVSHISDNARQKDCVMDYFSNELELCAKASDDPEFTQQCKELLL